MLATDNASARHDAASIIEAGETISKDDAAWVLANAFLILTMQTGFGMLEAGSGTVACSCVRARVILTLLQCRSRISLILW